MAEIRNKRAYFDYEIIEKLEAGIELVGCEVKSIRQNKASINESFARIKDSQVFLTNMHITPYSHGNRNNPEETRERKLLLKRKEIDKLTGKIEQKGFTLIPLKVYIKNNRYVKVLLGLGKSKKLFNKKDQIKQRDIDRDIERKFKIR